MGAFVMAMFAGLGLYVAFGAKKAEAAPAAAQIFPGVPNEISFRGFGLTQLVVELCGESEEVMRAAEVFALGAATDPAGSLIRLRASLVAVCPDAAQLSMNEAEQAGISFAEEQGLLVGA